MGIAVAVLPARGTRASNDPIAVLMGGPGESAIAAASYYDRQFGPLLDDRDLLLVDQPGSGGSTPLNCDLTPNGDRAPLMRDIFPPLAVETCSTRLGRDLDLTRFGYQHFATDIEMIRRRLRYGRLNLFGGSYGTRAEQVFLRTYPNSVRTAFVGSVVPLDVVVPATMAAIAQVEIGRMFASCTQEPGCKQAFPALENEFEAIMARLDAGDVRVRLTDGPPLALTRGPVASWVRSRLYRPSAAAELPWAIHRAYLGDWRPIADGVTASADAELSFGLFFAITCNEDMRFVSAREAKASRTGFLGDYRLAQQSRACRFWPKSDLPAGYREPVKSEVPTLFVTGANDGGTPVWFTQHAARGFRRHVTILAPGQGHTEWSPCINRQYARLLQQGSVNGMSDGECPVPRPPFRTK